jgi:D-alanyl-D-alanine carboxypeptidase
MIARYAIVIAALLVAGPVLAESATPRHHPHKRAIHGPDYQPPYAAIVVDDNSGDVLHELSADDLRHPASLTKIMTLYLLFEQLDAGKLRLDTPLQVSTQAALQRPTKLGLKANQTIKVEDAIRGMVTKSGNDAAVVVSEAIGGSEGEFANLMTRKARALGMASTTYVNASGLPAEEQITTARDQAILGRAIQHRFPGYYRYFATPSFRYNGVEMHNHNSLLGQVKGVDGIKTGYTEASGYNLVASVRRNGKHIVAVVLGGTSNAARNARMRELIENHMVQASALRTAPLIMEMAGQDNPQTSVDAVGTAGAGAGGSVALTSTSADQARASKPVAQSPKLQAMASKMRIQASMPQAQGSKLMALAKGPPHRAPRPTSNKAAALSALKAASMSTLAQSRK